MISHVSPKLLLSAALLCCSVFPSLAVEPYETWAILQFGANAGDPAIAGPEEDPEADGWRNAVEYVLGFDPELNSEPTADALSIIDQKLNYVFVSTNRADARVRVEISGVLVGSWTLAAASEHGAAYVPEAGFSLLQTALGDTRSVNLTEDLAGANPRFLRLLVDIIGLPPSVTLTSPPDAASNLLPSAVSVTFSQAMNPATLTVQSAAGPCMGSIQISRDDFVTCLPCAGGVTLTVGDTVASVTPAPGLALGANYKIRVLGTVERALGAKLGTTFEQAVGFTTPVELPCPAHLVISQVYGAGGNVGAPYDADFIELHNSLPTPVSLNNHAVQYLTAAGAGNWAVRPLPNVVIPAGGYYLMQTTSAGANGSAFAADLVLSPTISMAASSGKVALTSNTAALSGANPTGVAIVDLLGYGTTATGYEGSSPAPAPSTTTSIQRKKAGCQDTDDNAADFLAAAAVPRYGGTPPLICHCAINETSLASEADYVSVAFPASFSVQASTSTPQIFARIFEAGVTEIAGPYAFIQCQIGYGPQAANPQYQAGWTWVPATWNIQVGNDDEYQATLTAPAPGTYAYTARFSFDGVNWTYADLDGAGANAGLTFDSTSLGVMTVLE